MKSFRPFSLFAAALCLPLAWLVACGSESAPASDQAANDASRGLADDACVGCGNDEGDGGTSRDASSDASTDGPSSAACVDDTSCGDGGTCENDGLCSCPVGEYACATGCCPYEVTAVNNLPCMFDVDLAAVSPERWSLVTFLQNSAAQEEETAVWLAEAKPGAAVVRKKLKTLTYEPARNAYLHAAVAIDLQGQSHVVYNDWWSATLKYAGPSGLIETIDCAPKRPESGAVDIVVDSSGHPHVAWVAHDDPVDDGFIVHSERSTAGTWSCEPVVQSVEGAFVGGIEIKLDAQERPAIAYRRSLGSPPSVELSRRNSGSWTPTSFSAGVDELMGESVALGIAQSGAPFVAYELRKPVNGRLMTALLGGNATPVVAFVPSTPPTTTLDLLAAGAVGTSDHVFTITHITGEPSGIEDVVTTSSGWHIDHVASNIVLAAATVDPMKRGHVLRCDGTGTKTSHLLR